LERSTSQDAPLPRCAAGKIAQLGQRLIDGAAKSMTDDFFKRFDAEMKRRHGRRRPRRRRRMLQKR